MLARLSLFVAVICRLSIQLCAAEPAKNDISYAAWQHSGSIFILTTPECANLPADASEDGFPLLVRLHKDFFNFSQAKANGEDIRFSTSAGAPLAYQVDEWDAGNGNASIWVRIPAIKGNTRQEIKLYWGKHDAASESSGSAVFNDSNGYLSVWHMNAPVKDETGTLQSKDVGTTSATGMIGQARHLAGRQGVYCGEKIPNYPAGADAHSSEAWFRSERPNTTILGWGNEGGGRGSKVRMQLRSPPHVHIDSDFADVNGEGAIPSGEWVHVVHTYDKNDGKIYINGKLDGSATPLLNIKQPARMWIGGWYNNYDFVGDIDEVRISKVARSANWVRLEYENQKPLQTLTGIVVQEGNAFSVSQNSLTVLEGKSATVTAVAGGAQKIYWTIKREGQEKTAAVDRFSFTLDAGRITGDKSLTLQFKAIYPNEVKTFDIPVTIKEDIQDPILTLKSPAFWDGRETIEIVPQISNLNELQAKGADHLSYRWATEDFAVTSEIKSGKLILKRAQNSGSLKVRLSVSNGGTPVTAESTIQVKEPLTDAWIARVPDSEEKPEDNQFFARNDHNEGELYYNGSLMGTAETAFLKVYAGDELFKSESSPLSAERKYAFSIKLKPGLVKYKVEFGSKIGTTETVLRTVTNLVCGDAYIVEGQSNAESTSWGKEEYPETSEWIRTYGSMGGDPKSSQWGNAIRKGKADRLQIGFWPYELARRLVENQKIPICIINGAVGGTRIDQHQRNPDNSEDLSTIYGRLLWRSKQARLTHGIRGILWHQGEADQGADGPDGGFGYETYRRYFIEMAGAWKQDFPNIQHYYMFQIWPNACSQGSHGSDNFLRETQRSLRTAFSHMSIMSTLGISPPGGCHYPPAGYVEFARLMCPLVERDNYGRTSTVSITPPDLISARYSSDKTSVILEFDQPVKWEPALTNEFYLDEEKGKVTSGNESGNLLTLKLAGPSNALTITYLDSRTWSQNRLLRGENGIAALTFCRVPITAAR